MRHFDFLTDGDRDRLFLCPPETFSNVDDAELLGVALGATLYCPATRPNLAADIVRRAAEGVQSVVVCLEDSVADAELDAAERNAVGQLRHLGEVGASVPMIFVRVRDAEQIAMIVSALGDHGGVLSGFVVPKFSESTGADYLEAVTAESAASGHRLLVMPVMESPDIGHAESRTAELAGARRLLDEHREIVPAIRIGATDLSAVWGLRRGREFTVWDVRVVADAIASVVNVFGRSQGGRYVVTGPVWEYFPSAERMFKPQLRMSVFAEHAESRLRSDLIDADLDGLIREVVLDRANGLTGKTVIHPAHVAAVHALSVVTHEEHQDALDVLAAGSGGGAAASGWGNKMNESKPHTEWARRTLLRARAFGVAREQTSFVDLLRVGSWT